jgi:hypothetical protein
VEFEEMFDVVLSAEFAVDGEEGVLQAGCGEFDDGEDGEHGGRASRADTG